MATTQGAAAGPARTATLTMEFGALVRWQIRSAAFQLCLKLEENKGLITSEFRATGDAAKIAKLRRFVDAMIAEDARIDAEQAAEEAAWKAAWRWWNPATWF